MRQMLLRRCYSIRPHATRGKPAVSGTMLIDV